jgi:hypothetical protein
MDNSPKKLLGLSDPSPGTIRPNLYKIRISTGAIIAKFESGKF